jgi:hypothetical protein
VSCCGTTFAPHICLDVTSRSTTVYRDINLLLLLGVLCPAHTVLALQSWLQIDRTFAQLHRDGVLAASTANVLHLKESFNRRFNSHTTNWRAFTASLAIAFYLIASRSSAMLWWGHPLVSRYGYYCALFVATACCYQLALHNHKGVVGVRLFWAVVQQGLKLDFRHEDGVYGLGGIARTCLVGYGTTLIQSIALVLMWRAHFFSSRLDVALLFMLSFFVVFGPMFYVVPLLVLRSQIQVYKAQMRRELLLQRAGGWSPGVGVSPGDSANTVGWLLCVDRSIRALPDHPFSSGIILIGSSGYALQVLSAAITIIQVIRL